MEEIAVGRMDFDAVETCRDGIGRSTAEVGDDGGDFLLAQGSRRDRFLQALGKTSSSGVDGRGATGAAPSWKSGRDSRPQCQSWQTMSPPAAWTAAVTIRQPATWASDQIPGVWDSPALGRNDGALRDDQPGAGPLGVAGHQVGGDGARVVARQRVRGAITRRFLRWRRRGGPG